MQMITIRICVLHRQIKRQATFNTKPRMTKPRLATGPCVPFYCSNDCAQKALLTVTNAFFLAILELVAPLAKLMKFLYAVGSLVPE